MSKQNAATYTNGTSALKIPPYANSSEQPNIIAFPGLRAQGKQASHARTPEAPKHLHRPRNAFSRMLESSEMYCSLRLESMKGCPYHLFSPSSIAVLSVGASLIGIVSLILGA